MFVCAKQKKISVFLFLYILPLGEALLIYPKKHDALWCIGDAHTSYGVLTPDQTEARDHFEKATLLFQQALEEQPENDHYARSLELASKGPELNTEVHKHGLGPQPLGGTAGPPSTSAKITLRKLLSSYNKLFLFALFLVFIKFRLALMIRSYSFD